MKLKLHIAKWIVRRNEKRSRSARRALRDHQRQECSRIRHDERRTRGLRLYIAWTQQATATRRLRRHTVPTDAAQRTMGSVLPAGMITPQMAH